MTDSPGNILLCTCEGTMPIDTETVSRNCRGARVTMANHLCRAELARFSAAAQDAAPLIVGCVQEAASFSTAAADAGRAVAVTFTNLRETAGWSHDAAGAGPKMAALLAAAAEPLPPTDSVTLKSALEGRRDYS